MLAPDAAQLARTGRAITVGIWVCAAITMIASVVNGTSVFAALTTAPDGALDPMGITVGVLTALAVDACLVMVLCGDRQMQALGLSAAWGRVLRVGTLFMSLALNCGASLQSHDLFLAALHAIPPLLIVGMSEYGQEVNLTFTAEIRRRETARKATDEKLRREQQAPIDKANADAARIRREEDERRRRESHQKALAVEADKTAAALERKARAEQELADATERRTKAARAVLQPEQERPHLVVDNTRGKHRADAPKAPAKPASPVKSAAFDWLIKQHREGRQIADIGPTEIANAINANPDTCKKSHRAWKAELAELMEAAG